MSRRTTLLFFSILMISGSAVAWEGPFEILNKTFFDGGWEDATQEYNLPPEGGCTFPGVIKVVYYVYHTSDGEWDVYASEYGGCTLEPNGWHGMTIERGWVDMVAGKNTFITENIFNRQSNSTKNAILTRCGGVVSGSWHPFYGYPVGMYDVEIRNIDMLWGYVEVHFNQLSKIDGEFCIPNADAIIISSGSWHSFHSARWNRDEWNRELYNITDNTTYEIVDGVVHAKIKITLNWARFRYNTDGDKIISPQRSETTFFDSKPMPIILSEPPNASATIVSHNNSVSPYSIIDVTIDENIVSTEIIYKNKTSVYYNQVGILNSSDELTYFDFVREHPVWIQNQSNIVTRRAGYYIITEAPLSLNELTINVYTPYQTQSVTDYNVTVIDSKPSDYIYWKAMFGFLAILGVFVMTSYNLLRRFR